MKIAFIITRKRNNVVVSFGTIKVQCFMLTEVRDCDLLIVVTSSTFLKRKEILKEKRQSAQIIKARSPAYIYRQMYCVHLYGLHVYCALVDLDSSGSPSVCPTPGLSLLDLDSVSCAWLVTIPLEAALHEVLRVLS